MRESAPLGAALTASVEEPTPEEEEEEEEEGEDEEEGADLCMHPHRLQKAICIIITSNLLCQCLSEISQAAAAACFSSFQLN